MPYVVKAPIATKVGDEIRKFVFGQIVSDEDAENAGLLKSHAHALTRVGHSALVCNKSCSYHSHPWNQKTAASAPAPTRKGEPAPEAAK